MRGMNRQARALHAPQPEPQVMIPHRVILTRFTKQTADAAAQPVAHQRRATGIGTTLGTKPRAKIGPISWRNARPLHGRVGRALLYKPGG